MKVYADSAATTRMSRKAFAEMTRVMGSIFGNPSGGHFWSWEAKRALEDSREQIARCINAEPEEIYFTSGGTESNNWAMKITRPYHRVFSAIEHHSILRCLDDEGDSLFPVFPSGDVGECEDYSPYFSGTGAVSVMTANNEIGTIQPIREIAAICRRCNILFHTDAVQAVGHIPIDVKALGVDMLSASAHKFHGPKGVGFLYVRKGVYMEPLLYGGEQERGMRSGTENVPGVVGMAAALSEVSRSMEADSVRVTSMRDRLIDGLLEVPGSHLNGSRDNRLPGNVNIGFDGVEGSTLVSLLNQHGIAVSAGSACSAGRDEASHVLLAIGRSEKEAKSAIRISIDRYNTDDEIDYILKTVPECVNTIRSFQTV